MWQTGPNGQQTATAVTATFSPSESPLPAPTGNGAGITHSPHPPTDSSPRSWDGGADEADGEASKHTLGHAADGHLKNEGAEVAEGTKPEPAGPGHQSVAEGAEAKGKSSSIVYGTVSCWVVGTRHSRDLRQGDQVSLQRQPENPVDPNAIRVHNMRGAPVGFIESGVAQHLAPLMDKQLVRFQATIVGPVGRDARCSITVFGPNEPSRIAWACQVLQRVTQPPRTIVYGRVLCSVVEIYRYSGYVRQGDHVFLQRETGNETDPNAIRVNNTRGTQVGFIESGVDQHLAQLIDISRFQATIVGPVGQTARCLITVSGTDEPARAAWIRRQLEPLLTLQAASPSGTAAAAAAPAPDSSAPPIESAALSVSFSASKLDESEPAPLPPASDSDSTRLRRRHPPATKEG